MRTRDWRRFQREKRTRVAYDRAVKDYAEDIRHAGENRWYRVPNWQDTLRRFMRNEGVSRHQWPLHKKRCSECYRKPNGGCCEWCLSSRLRSVNRQLNAMDYEAPDLYDYVVCDAYYYDEIESIMWWDYLGNPELVDRLDFEAPLTTGLFYACPTTCGYKANEPRRADTARLEMAGRQRHEVCKCTSTRSGTA